MILELLVDSLQALLKVWLSVSSLEKSEVLILDSEMIVKWVLLLAEM